MSYRDSATHRLTQHAIEHDRLGDVREGDTFRTVASIETGRHTTSTFRDVVATERYYINGHLFVSITDASGDHFDASAHTLVDIERS